MASSSRRIRLFYPPLPSPLFIRLLRPLAPSILRRVWQIEAVDMEEADRERLRALRENPAIIAANHPSLAEPAVLFEAVSRAGASACFLTAWEVFTERGRLVAWLLQRAGCYSVMRGRRDRASMQMTEKLLAAGQRIVVFPEGQTYGLNDTLLPFQQGVVQLAFWALEAMRKQGIEGPLLVAPVAVKYLYTQPMEGEIEASLRRLEARLGLKPGARAPYARLREIAAVVVGSLERQEHLPAVEGGTLDERILRLRDVLVRRMAGALDVDLPPGAAFPDAVRLLANAYDDAILGGTGEPESEYDRGLREQAIDAVRPMHAGWMRLKNFLAVRDGYVQQLPSAERYLDVLGRLEVEVMGRSAIRGRRRALVKTGEPLNLGAHLDAYRRGKRETVAHLTSELESRVFALLSELMLRSKAVPGW
jgi:1-acyl-sn-glycerol-3-phosphate acyltransferase